MFKIAGHTMGTPDLTPEEAAELFAGIGMDAIEIIFQDDYKCGFNWSTSDEELSAFRHILQKLKLDASCIVAYASDYNSPDDSKREDAMKECRRCIEIAGILSAKFVRIYGGAFLAGDDNYNVKRAILIESMRTLADEAAKSDVSLVLENHFNTMTTGPQVTYDIVNDIGRENVGILYDQANISFLSGENYQESISIQKDKIAYVHVKDFIFKNDRSGFTAGSVSHVSEDERAVTSRVVGEGVLPWRDIITGLRDAGYSGFLSLEYERRWHPRDLPEPEIGMKKSFDFIRRIIRNI